MNVKFKEWNCKVIKCNYVTGHLALKLVDVEDGSPIATASVNLPATTDISEGYVYIKDWSENEGMLKALTEAGIVEPVGVRSPTGRCMADLCKYTGG